MPKQTTKIIIKDAKHPRKTKVRRVRPTSSNDHHSKTVKVAGRGAYSFRDFGRDVSTPFLHSRPGKGIVNKTARLVGSQVGNSLGIPGASTALGNAGSWLAKVFGFGAYKVKTNSLMTQNVAQFSDNGSITFSHREFIADVSSSVDFQNRSHIINPGNASLFPWLSTIARNFEQYEFLGLIFEFKSTSATAVGSTNTGLGTVIMATDYDVIDDPYTTKQSMEVADFATSSAPCNDQIHPIECDPKQNVLQKLYIQNAVDNASLPDDARFSVLGNFQLATSGMQAVSTIGELWVSYHVRLTKPQLDTNSNSKYAYHATFSSSINGLLSPVVEHTTVPGVIGRYSASGAYFIPMLLANAGAGSYMIISTTKSSNPLHNLTAVSGRASISGGSTAQFVGHSLNTSGVVISPFQMLGLSGWDNGPGQPACSQVVNICAVKFNKPGDTVNIPMATDLTDNTIPVWTDIWVLPYPEQSITAPPMNKHNLLQELSRLRTKIDSSSKDEVGSKVVELGNTPADADTPTADDPIDLDPKDLYLKGIISAEDLVSILKKQTLA